jgi:hypothetical protein
MAQPMSLGLIALLAGLFVIPVILLYIGHRLRRRSRRWRLMFWGALLGHTVAAVFALWYSMIPPETWTSADFTRGLFGFYGMLLGALTGALAGLALSLRAE